MNKLKLIILFLLVISGCQSIPNKPDLKFMTPEQTPTINLIMPKETSTIAFISQPSPTVTEMPSTPPICQDISIIPFPKGTYFGTLVLKSITREGNSYLDMNSGKEWFIASSANYLTSDLTVSPNRKWIAYINEERNLHTENLVIQSIDNNKKYIYPKNNQDWQNIAYWLNNETLVLWNHIPIPDKIIMLNPFTGNLEIMENNFPEMIPDETVWKQFWPSLTIYSPLLDKLVYLKNGKDGYKLGDVSLTLFDLKSHNVITEIEHFGYTQNYPLWKSDGSGFIYVKSNPGNNPSIDQDEVYFLSSNGKKEQLTNLRDYYKNIQISSYSLSPDETLLAFTVRLTQNIDKELAKWENHLFVLNLSNHQLKDYCFTPSIFQPIIWSKDGHQLIFSEIINNNEDNSQAMLIDFNRRIVFKVDDQLNPVGWLDNQK